MYRTVFRGALRASPRKASEGVEGIDQTMHLRRQLATAPGRGRQGRLIAGSGVVALTACWSAQSEQALCDRYEHIGRGHHDGLVFVADGLLSVKQVASNAVERLEGVGPVRLDPPFVL